MDIRELARGTVEWHRLERVARVLADRYDRSQVRVEFLDVDNWLSTPCVVDDEWFVKIVSRQNARVHGLLTAGRNVGALSAGTGGFFDRFGSPLEMVEHDYRATRRIRETGCNAPRPVEAFGVNGLGVLVLEFLPGLRPLDELSEPRLGEIAPRLFEQLATLHDGGLAHGDIRAENVLLSEGRLYFIDATGVRESRRRQARGYDLASAMAILEPRIGARATVGAAATQYGTEDLIAAREFLDFVRLRPDHEFDSTRLRGEVEKAVDIAESA